MKILITGGTGYVGCHLLNHILLHPSIILRKAISGISVSIIYTYNSSNRLNINHSIESNITLESYCVNISNYKEVESLIIQYKPDVCVHTAALTNTGKCKENKKLAEEVNVDGTANIVQALAKFSPKTRFIHMSTDWIYQGDLRDKLRTEIDDNDFDGFGVYGVTKKQAEKSVINGMYDYIILRSALIFGPPAPYSGKSSFLKWMIDGLDSKHGLNLFKDEYRTPICVFDVIKTIMHFATQKISSIVHPPAKRCKVSSEKDGNAKTIRKYVDDISISYKLILNMGGPQRLSRFEMGKILAKQLKIDNPHINGVLVSSVIKDPSARPKDLSMDSTKLYKMLSAHNVSPTTTHITSSTTNMNARTLICTDKDQTVTCVKNSSTDIKDDATPIHKSENIHNQKNEYPVLSFSNAIPQCISIDKS